MQTAAAFAEWAVQSADTLNFCASVLLVGVGLAVLWAGREFILDSTDDRSPALHAYVFWLAAWSVTAILFLLRLIISLPLWITFLFNDAQSLMIIGFSVVFVTGTSYRPRYAWTIFATVLVALGLVESSIGLTVPSEEQSVTLRYLWMLPSALLALVAWFGFAQSFLLRFGWGGIPMAAFGIAYAWLEWPVYTSIVVQQQPSNQALLTLAVLKMALGWGFYVYFLAVRELEQGDRWAPVGRVALNPDLQAYLRQQGRRLWTATSAILLLVAGALLNEWL